MTSPSVVPVPAPPPNDELELLLRLGDDRLVLGHRLSEWCGHAPILEEDIALANVALDLLGQATLFLRRAGEAVEERHEVRLLALLRRARPLGADRAAVRELLLDDGALLAVHPLERIAALAAKSLKEAKYHVRHSGEWMLMLGDGTDESHRRVQRALDELWRFTPELFVADGVAARLAVQGIAPDLPALHAQWETIVRDVVGRATLTLPHESMHSPHLRGGRSGMHSEHLGHMLAELQIVARSHPGAKW